MKQDLLARTVVQLRKAFQAPKLPLEPQARRIQFGWLSHDTSAGCFPSMYLLQALEICEENTAWGPIYVCFLTAQLKTRDSCREWDYKPRVLHPSFSSPGSLSFFRPVGWVSFEIDELAQDWNTLIK